MMQDMPLVRTTSQPHESRSHGVGAAEILRRLEVTETDLEWVRYFGQLVLPKMDSYNRLFYDWMQHQPEWATFFQDAARLQHVQQRQGLHWRDLFEVQRIDDDYVARRVRVGEIHARVGLSLTAYFAGIDKSAQVFLRDLYDGSLSPADYATASLAVSKLIHIDAMLVLDAYTRSTTQKIADQAHALLEMSTPVTALWDHILMLPVVGIIDSNRAQDIMAVVLRSIADTRAKVFIMDIGGVPVVDTAVANHLIKITRATRLMGCQSVLSGVSPTIAQTMVELGIDVGGILTKATLRDAMEAAYDVVGLRVVSTGTHAKG
jgi:rsbT co-antagonist protein RsbR